MDPISTFGRPLTVTEEEVSAAVRPVLMDRLRDGLRKLSLSFAKNLNLKQRSKSLSSMFGKDGSSASPTPSNESAMAAAQVAVAISQRPPTSVQTAKLGSLNGTVSASSLANIHIPPPAPPGHNVFASRSPSIRGKTPVAPGTPRLSTGSWFAPAEDSSIVPHSPQSPRSSSASIALQHLQFMRPASSMMNSPNPATPTPFAEDYIVPILGPASRNGSTAALPAVGSVSNLSQGFRTQAQARTAATRASGTSLATLLAAAGGGTPADAAAFLAMQEQGVDVLKQALVAQQLQQQQHMEGRGSRTGTPTDLAGGSEHHAAAPLPVPVAQQKVRTEPMLDSGAALEKQRRWRERVMLSKFGKTAASSSSSSSSGNSDDKGAERDDEASSLTPVQKVNGSGAAGLPQDMAPRASFLLGESSAEEDTESGVDEFVVRERERVKQWNM
ncbi:hypothetical protein BC830DRAFT_598572 [Chytriomyces sp. MP71]|nr:hypothetical protein BC830DRAFT_598572 [Chytriomyces sp. MP71]